MRRLLRSFRVPPLLLGAVALLAAPATARAQLADAKVLTDAAVKQMMDAAESHARANGWRVSIAITDAYGELLAFRRLDGASLISIGISQGKASTAARFKRPTKVLADAVAEGRMNLVMSVPGTTVLQGGLPIVVDGVTVGGIGVSGVTSEQDEQVAQAGIGALFP